MISKRPLKLGCESKMVALAKRSWKVQARQQQQFVNVSITLRGSMDHIYLLLLAGTDSENSAFLTLSSRHMF